MLIISKLSRNAQSLFLKGQSNIGFGKAILHYIRTVMNRIRWEENRQINSLQARNNNVPKNVEQANKLFVATQKQISLNQKARMQRIDNILGTNTHYQEVKPYQERLDSDHVMELEELKRIHREPSRKELNWLNPKVEGQLYKYKNKKKHYQHISKLRTYPQHSAKKYDFADQKNENTISFLGKEAVYSKISLKPIQLTVESMQKQVIGFEAQKPFQSERYVYFRPIFTMQLFRIQKTLYQPQVMTDQKVFASLQHHLQQVISLEEIYEILKEYDTDERVSEYLAKIENNRLEYFFSQFTYDKHQNVFAVVIDLLGTNKEYCLIVKNISNSGSYQTNAIFNIRPQVIFSADCKHICYIQRSPEGGWIELVYRPVQSCWRKEGDLTLLEDQEIMYRCEPQKELNIGTDSNKNYIFLTIRQYNKQFSQSLFVIHKEEEDALTLIPIDQSPNCKYYYDVSPLGIICSVFTQASHSYLKYGKNSKVATSIQLVPYKQHLLLHQQLKPGLNDGLLPSSQSKNTIPPTELDVGNKKTIYTAGQNEFIRQIQVRSTHIVIALNLQSTYNKFILYFLPFKPNAHPHSLILSGGTSVQLNNHSYAYNSQVVQFQKPTGLLLTEKVYNIWKKQLKDGSEDLKRYHYQRIIINQDSYPIEVPIFYRSLYHNERLPVLIYFASRNEELEPTPLRQFLEKGVMVVEFRGRGTFSQDLQHYLNGSRHNLSNMLDDLQCLIQFIGNNMTKNISLYCKGQVSSLIGLWFNIYFPFLFNATVLHNGVFDLQDEEEMDKLKDFFTVSDKSKERWDHFNIFKHQFKQTTRQETSSKQMIGTLQNVIISSDQHHRIHSRKLIHKLRSNSAFRYDQVYLKEYQDSYEADLYNLSYFYSKIRIRMQEQINEPQGS